MISESALMRITNKITGYIDESVRLAGANHVEEVTDLFDKIHSLFPGWIIMTCPVMHPDVHYISRNSNEIFGTETADYFNKNLSNYFHRVHNTDQADLQSCFEALHEYLRMIPSDQHIQYRGILHYRFRKPNGQYVYLHDEKAVINFNGSGNLYFALIRDITTEKKFEGVKLEIYSMLHPHSRLKEFKPGMEKSRLTKRENDLVTLIKQGLSTKEIAWYLKISHHTVRNTKSKLFEKFKVNNAIELLNVTANQPPVLNDINRMLVN
ncbi:MAG: LuxR family transcriptional regulator [Sphingobacteriales bacterium]|nr:MAG: LuxR family transcriptional regulator [Sphingobacteriales bacterium]